MREKETPPSFHERSVYVWLNVISIQIRRTRQQIPPADMSERHFIVIVACLQSLANTEADGGRYFAFLYF